MNKTLPFALSLASILMLSGCAGTQELASRSNRASTGLYGDASAHGGIGIKAFGTGGGVSFKGGVRVGVDGEDLDSHQASSSSRASQDARHNVDAKASQDFKEASDYFTSRKVSESGSHTDNNAASRADQLSASLSSAKQSLEQYSTSQARSKEYAEMASRTESMSGQINEDLNQQFAQYVRKQAPHDADRLLTDTASPEVAKERRELAWSFVQSQVQPAVDNAYSDAKDGLGQNMSGVSVGGGNQDVLSDYKGHHSMIENATTDAGIRGDVGGSVEGMMEETRNNVAGTHNKIEEASKKVDEQYTNLESNHQSVSQLQQIDFDREKASQNAIPGTVSPEDLLEKAKKLDNAPKK